jgi:biopolymer transport protein TolR
MTVNADGEQVQAQINVTPMIDVLLVLLIVFMSIAPVQSTGLNAIVPRAASNEWPVEHENPVVLAISNDGTLRLNAEMVSGADLHQRLVELFRRRAERVLFVKAPGNLEFALVASAIDTAHGANVDRVALLPR